MVVLQTALWLFVLFGAMRVSVPLARRRSGVVTDETLITLSDTDTAPIDDYVVESPDEEDRGSSFRDPGLDATGQLSRLAVAEGPDPGDAAASAEGDEDDDTPGSENAP
jgi:hypothetical protein